MKPDAQRGLAQQRNGAGTAKALQAAFPPDAAAADLLGRLIEQIDGLPWPRSSSGEKPASID